MPLTSSFLLSTKAKNRAWCKPRVQVDGRTIAYEVHVGEASRPRKQWIAQGVGACSQVSPSLFLISGPRARQDAWAAVSWP